MEENLHYLQMSILKNLTYTQRLKFSELKEKIKVNNTHLSYHLKALLNLGLIKKEGDSYSLTKQGKVFVSHLDKDNLMIEKLPKVVSLVIAEKVEAGKTKLLIQKRTKEPMYGFSGFVAGKVKQGELAIEAAERELVEETGLEADFKHKFVLHEILYHKEKDIKFDGVLCVFLATNVRGDMINTKEGENKWVSEKEFYKISPKFMNEEEIYKLYKDGFTGFKEKRYFE